MVGKWKFINNSSNPGGLNALKTALEIVGKQRPFRFYLKKY